MQVGEWLRNRAGLGSRGRRGGEGRLMAFQTPHLGQGRLDGLRPHVLRPNKPGENRGSRGRVPLGEDRRGAEGGDTREGNHADGHQP